MSNSSKVPSLAEACGIKESLIIKPARTTKTRSNVDEPEQVKKQRKVFVQAVDMGDKLNFNTLQRVDVKQDDGKTVKGAKVVNKTVRGYVEDLGDGKLKVHVLDYYKKVFYTTEKELTFQDIK